MICRVWYGWATPANADKYEQFLRDEVFPGIRSRGIPGFHKIELLRRDAGEEVEFATLMWFDSIESIKAFAGPDYKKAVVKPQAQAVLSRYQQEAQHFNVEPI